MNFIRHSASNSYVSGCSLQLRRGGYIAAISLFLISGFVVVVIVALSLASFIGRGVTSRSEFKERSNGLAEACVELAKLKLSRNIDYPGGETFTVDGSDTCTIVSITASSTSAKLVKATALFRNSVTNLKVILRTSDLAVLSWEEVKSF